MVERSAVEVPRAWGMADTQRIEIYQAWYLPAQQQFLDGAFTSLDNTANPHPDWSEYYFFLQHYNAGRHRQAHLTGILSWRFFEKTRVPGAKFVQFIRENPGYDVYSINPFPSHHFLHRSVWAQGEKCHPGLLSFAQEMMDDLGIAVDLKALQHTDAQALYCNYWVGTEAFWEKYMAFTKPMHDWMVARLRGKEVHSKYDARYSTRRLTFYAFVMERMFTTLLAMDPAIRHAPYRYPDEYLLLHKEYSKILDNDGNALNDTMHLARHISRLPGANAVSSAIFWTVRAFRRSARKVKVFLTF